MERTLKATIANRKVVTIKKEESVLQAAQEMTANNTGSVVVVEGQNLVGILTERDILNKLVSKGLNSKTTKVESLMTENPYTAKESMPVSHALYLMREHGFRHIPVLDSNGNLKGMFSIKDALPHEVNAAITLEDRFEQIARSCC